MFSSAPMMRLKAVILERDKRTVLRELGRLGTVQPIRTLSGPETAPLPSSDHCADIARCDRIRARIEELRRSLEIPSPFLAALSTTSDLNQAEKDLVVMEEQAGYPLSRRQHLIDQQNQLTVLCEQAMAYCGLDIPLDGLDQFSFLFFVNGSMPEDNFEHLRNEIDKNAVLVPLARQNGRQTMIAITSRMKGPALENTLRMADFRRDDLPAAAGSTIDSFHREKKQEQEKVEKELERLNTELRTLAAQFTPSLIEVEAITETERRLLEVEQAFPRTEATTLLTGWVPADKTRVLEEGIKESTGGRYVLEMTKPRNSAGEEVPVLFRHSRLLRPFETLVSTYGLPDYRELEPTLFVALSYVIMFGMMFGDAGHGGILTACGFAALLTGRSEKVRDLGILFLSAGLSSIIFGIIYGSCFGIAFFKKYAIWHDPLEGDPMSLIYGAVVIGIVMISLGLVLNVLNRFRRGDVVGAFLDKFGLAGLLFYWGALVLLIGGPTIQSQGVMIPAVILFLGVPIAGWTLKEPVEFLLNHGDGQRTADSGGLTGAIAESFVGAFEAVLSYLANTISFVRLAAYAMSHAALLVAAFMLAAEIQRLLPGGTFWGILIIILGNMVAIILEGIIASVQALRLEYYEFFGKFFSGNGRAFEPFRLTESAHANP